MRAARRRIFGNNRAALLRFGRDERSEAVVNALGIQRPSEWDSDEAVDEDGKKAEDEVKLRETLNEFEMRLAADSANIKGVVDGQNRRRTARNKRKKSQISSHNSCKKQCTGSLIDSTKQQVKQIEEKYRKYTKLFIAYSIDAHCFYDINIFCDR